MDFSREQPEKAPTPTCATLSGMVTETKFVQLEHVSNTIERTSWEEQCDSVGCSGKVSVVIRLDMQQEFSTLEK